METTLKHVKAKKFGLEYNVKITYDDETNRYCRYANNSDFNWGGVSYFDTKEEAENDFVRFLDIHDKFDWKEVK